MQANKNLMHDCENAVCDVLVLLYLPHVMNLLSILQVNTQFTFEEKFSPS